MRYQVLISVLLLFLTACSPSQHEIQSTIQAAVAQTQIAAPTATVTPAPTLTHTPSPTATATPGIEQLLGELNITIRLMEGRTQVMDVRYLHDADGLVLQMDAMFTAEEYDQSEIAADVFTALARSYDRGFPFDQQLFALRVVCYDIDLSQRGFFVSEWTDVVAWFEEEISTEQLIRRLIIMP